MSPKKKNKGRNKSKLRQSSQCDFKMADTSNCATPTPGQTFESPHPIAATASDFISTSTPVTTESHGNQESQITSPEQNSSISSLSIDDDLSNVNMDLDLDKVLRQKIVPR